MERYRFGFFWAFAAACTAALLVKMSHSGGEKAPLVNLPVLLAFLLAFGLSLKWRKWGSVLLGGPIILFCIFMFVADSQARSGLLPFVLPVIALAGIVTALQRRKKPGS